MKTVGLKQMLN